MSRRLVVLLSSLLIAACSQAAATDPPDEPAAPIERDASSDPPDEILRALEGVHVAETGRFAFSVGVEVGQHAGPSPLHTVDEGAFDHREVRYSRHLSRPSAPFGGVDLARFVIDGDDLYMWAPDDVPGLVPGWVVTTHPGGSSALIEDALADGLLEDPVALTAVLSGAGPLVPDGLDDVEGDRAERFRTTVPFTDVVALVESGDSDGGSPFDELVDIVEDVEGAGSIEPATAIVWLLPDGRLRRYELELTMPIPRSEPGPGIVVRISLDLYDYGEDITIEVPDPSEVQPVP